MTIKSALKDWVMQVSGLDGQHVILANQNGAQPVGDFATFDILTVVTHDYPDAKQTDLGGGNLQFDYTVRNELFVSIESYSKDGLNLLQDLAISNHLFSVRQILAAEKLALLRAGDPRNLAAPSETEWKPRFQCDFVMNSYHTLTEIIEQITAYDFTGKFIRDKNVIDTVGFSVNPNP